MARNALWKHAGTTLAQIGVRNRLIELDRNPFEAAKIGDLPRTFLYEFLTGKKRSFRGESMTKFAKALNWTVNELTAIVSGNGERERAVADPVDRSVAEAAFLGLMRLFRPDIENESALAELFRTLATMEPDSRSTAPLVEQMFFRAQLPARQFALRK